MTVTTQVSRALYIGDGVTTEFDTQFKFPSGTSVSVSLFIAGEQIPQVEGTHYSISGGGVPTGGVVTFFTPPVLNAVVVLQRVTSRLQQRDYSDFNNFPAESHEGALDQLTYICQELADLLDRAATAGDDWPIGVSLRMPLPEAGAGLMWNDEGTELINSPFNLRDLEEAASVISIVLPQALAARDEAVAARDEAVAAATSIALPSAAPAESGRGLVVAPEGGWALGGTAAAKNVGTGAGQIPLAEQVNALVNVEAQLTPLQDKVAFLAMRMMDYHSADEWGMGAGFVDEFFDTTGIAVQENFDHVAVGFIAATPVTGGTPTASSTFSGQPASNARDANLSTYWMANQYGSSEWLRVDFGEEKTVWGAGIVSAASEPDRAPKNYNYQYSHDNSTWTNAVVVTGSATWSANERRKHMFTPVTARYWRVLCQSNGTSSAYRIAELEFYGNVGTDATLESTSRTADVAPPAARALLRIVTTGELNTDVKAFVSRDGGTTYTQGYLIDTKMGEAAVRVLAVSGGIDQPLVDLSGQPTGTSMRIKLTSSSATDVRGWALRWA